MILILIFAMIFFFFEFWLITALELKQTKSGAKIKKPALIAISFFWPIIWCVVLIYFTIYKLNELFNGEM